MIHDLLSISSYQCLFLVDIKYGYWVANIHTNDRYYLAFYISAIGQVQPTRMLQGAKTLVFTFNKLINIIFKPILSLQLDFSLFYKKTAQNIALLAFYIDNIFEAFKTYQK